MGRFARRRFGSVAAVTDGVVGLPRDAGCGCRSAPGYGRLIGEQDRNDQRRVEIAGWTWRTGIVTR